MSNKKITQLEEVTSLLDSAYIPIVQGNPMDDYKISKANLKASIGGGGSGGGDSAYEIALDNGFQGTEQEWLASLQGEDGTNGRGIASLVLVSTVGLVKTYRITYTDSTTFTYTVTDGKDGIDGGGYSVKLVINKEQLVWSDGFLAIPFNFNKEILNPQLKVKNGAGYVSLSPIISFPASTTNNINTVFQGFYLSDADNLLKETFDIETLYLDYNVGSTILNNYDSKINVLGHNVIVEEGGDNFYHSRAGMLTYKAVYPNSPNTLVESILDPLTHGMINQPYTATFCTAKDANIISKPYWGAALEENVGSNPNILSVGSHTGNSNEYHNSWRYDITSGPDVFLSNTIAIGARPNNTTTVRGATSYGYGLEFFEEACTRQMNIDYPTKNLEMAIAQVVVDVTGYIVSSTVQTVFGNNLTLGDEVWLVDGNGEHRTTVAEIISPDSIRVSSQLPTTSIPEIYLWHYETLGFVWGSTEFSLGEIRTDVSGYIVSNYDNNQINTFADSLQIGDEVFITVNGVRYYTNVVSKPNSYMITVDTALPVVTERYIYLYHKGETDVPNDGEHYWQSPTTTIVAAKLNRIQDATGANWQVIRMACRATASNNGVWDMYRGFGIINVDAAISYIQANNASVDDRKHLADKLEFTHGLSPFLEYSDLLVNSPVSKKMLEEKLDGIVVEETDPTVPAWAKEATKPSYTTSEVSETTDKNYVTDSDILNIAKLDVNYEKLDTLTTKAKQLTGFEFPENITVTYVGGAIQLTATAGNLTAYWRGIEIAGLTATDTNWLSSTYVANPTLNTTNKYFLYYNGTNFVWSTSIWTFDLLMIAMLYYNGTNWIAVREVHGMGDRYVHEQMHFNTGASLRSGGDMSGIVTGSSTVANRRPSISAFTIADEDLLSAMGAVSSGDYTQFYLTGANTHATIASQSDVVLLDVATGLIPQYINSSFSRVNFSVGNYGKIFLLAQPTTDDEISKQSRLLFIQPQKVSNTLATIQAITTGSINLDGLGALLNEFVFIGEIIIKYQSSNDWNIYSFAKITGTKISQTISAGGGITSVVTDTTLTGNGTTASPLSVVGITQDIDGATTGTIGILPNTFKVFSNSFASNTIVISPTAPTIVSPMQECCFIFSIGATLPTSLTINTSGVTFNYYGKAAPTLAINSKYTYVITWETTTLAHIRYDKKI